MSQEREQQQKKKQQPSAELMKEVVTLYKEISNSIPKIKDLYSKVDLMALEEGFIDGEIYDITNYMYKELCDNMDHNNKTTTDNTTTNKNTNSTYPYSQYFK